MINKFINIRKSIIVGILILVAYSMLTYDITKIISLGVIADLISGFSVIGIAVIMFPIFNYNKNKFINLSFLLCKIIEGALMIAGGALLIFPDLIRHRSYIYQNIHIYFFIAGALFFYILLLKTLLIPKFISIWGIIASITLFIITIIKLFGIKIDALDILLLPMVLNEVFLAFWLIIKGFNNDKI